MIENKTRNLKLYSQKAIGLATFIGGPIAAGYLIRENYLSFDKPDEGKKSLVISIIATVLLFTAIFMLPESVMDKVPNQILPIIYTGIIYLIVDKIHGTILKNHKENDNEFHSNWKAAGVGFVAMIILLIGIFGYAYLAPEEYDYEQYDTNFADFSKNEEESLVFYDHLKTENTFALIKELDNSTIPKWKDNISIIESSNKIENLPIDVVQYNNELLKYSELRVKAFELFRKSISEDSDKYTNELEAIHVEIQKQLEILK